MTLFEEMKDLSDQLTNEAVLLTKVVLSSDGKNVAEDAATAAHAKGLLIASSRILAILTKHTL